MPSPCGIIFNGKEYSYEDFAAYLHEGGLDKLVADKVIDNSNFKQKVERDERIGKEVGFEHAGSERTGIVQSIDEKGNLKIKDSKGINYTIPEERIIKTGNDYILEGIKEIKQALSKPTGALALSPQLVTGVAKIGYGLIKNGVATGKNVFEKIREYLKENDAYEGFTEKDLADSRADIEAKIKELNQRSFLRTVQDSEATTEQMNKMVAEQDQFYEVMSNKESLAAADKKIAEDITAARDYVMNNGEPSAEKSAMAIRLIKHYEKAKDYDNAIEILNEYDRQLREAGRFVQAASLWNKLAPETVLRTAKREADKIGQPLTPDVQKEILRRMGEIDKMPEGQGKDEATMEALNYIAQQLPLSKWELLDAYRYQNMLSNPRAHLRNIYGNMFNVFITEPLSLATRSGYDMFNDMYNPQARDAKFAQVPQYYKDVVTNIPNAIMSASLAFKQGYISSKILEAGSTESQIEMLRRANAPKYLTFVTRFLEAQDKFFSTLIASGEKARLMRNGVSEVEANAQAIKLAEEYLYREQLSPKEETKLRSVRALDSVGQALNEIRKKPIIGKPFGWFVPFVTTPINVAKLGVKFSPIAAVEISAGKLMGKQYAKTDVANATVGSVVSAVGAVLAMQGLTTWAAPKDKKEKELFYASGRKPYSIKIGDEWVPMAYFGPLSLALAMPAAAKNYHEDTKTSLTDSEYEKLKDSVFGVASYISAQTSLASVGGLMEILSGNQDYTLEKVLGNIGGQFVPAGGFVRYVNSIYDPIYRKAKTAVEQIESGIPELSKELEPIKDIKGKEVKRDAVNYILPYDLGFNKEDYSNQLKVRRKMMQEREAKKSKSKGKKITTF